MSCRDAANGLAMESSVNHATTTLVGQESCRNPRCLSNGGFLALPSVFPRFKFSVTKLEEWDIANIVQTPWSCSIIFVSFHSTGRTYPHVL